MRNYCRVYHTSLDYLAAMPVSQLMAELEDAAEDLMEEQRRHEREMKEQKAKMKSQSRSRPRRRRR